MRLWGQFQASFFYEKILSVQEAPKSNHLLRSFCVQKKPLSLLFFVRLFLFCWLVGFGWFAFLYAQNLFVKKSKLAWNCPDSLILLYHLNGTKNALFFFRELHHIFTLNMRVLFEMKRMFRLSKNVCGVFRFWFCFIFIKVYIFV